MVVETPAKMPDQYGDLPIPYPDEDTLVHLFRGKFIAIYQKQVIVVESSYEAIKQKAQEIVPPGKKYSIKFVDAGAFIYGICI
ncbi:MAG TPA: DUF5678 domain-containing protein [Candidatus Lokiarchaeia archaeon]|nr:DUF5678 domain-containing protein [Candidatus Lokiarchaeia archaeon]